MAGKSLAIGIIILFLFCNISFTTLSDENIGNLGGKTLYVGGSGTGNYTRIQDAVDDASDGDTVFVYSGTYYENIMINKSVTLTGKNREDTIIDGKGVSDVLYIIADNVSIHNFSIRNSGRNFDDFYNADAGIQISSNNANISDCIFKDNYENYISIYLLHANYNTIFRNNLSSTGSIYVIFSSYNTISDNILKSTWGGIILGETSFNVIKNNILTDVYIYSIGIWTSSNTLVSSNKVAGNLSYGILVIDSYKNSIDTNYVSIGSGMLGFESFILGNSSNNTIEENHIYNSRWNGIVIFSSSNYNTIVRNNLTNNSNGGLVIAYSSNNYLDNNNIIKTNGHSIELYGGSTKNTISNNYISGIGINVKGGSYSGIDLKESSSDNKIIANYITDHNLNGIDVDSDNILISNNYITNNRFEGIHIEGSNNISIKKNTIENNNRDGIRLEDFSTNNKILKNKISENGNNGIFLSNSCDNNSIFGNTISKNKEFGIHLEESSNNCIKSNNFMFNEKDVFFELCNNRWCRNYWNRPRLLPFIIEGETSTEIDYYPRLLPFDIFGLWKL